MRRFPGLNNQNDTAGCCAHTSFTFKQRTVIGGSQMDFPAQSGQCEPFVKMILNIVHTITDRGRQSFFCLLFSAAADLCGKCADHLIQKLLNLFLGAAEVHALDKEVADVIACFHGNAAFDGKTGRHGGIDDKEVSGIPEGIPGKMAVGVRAEGVQDRLCSVRLPCPDGRETCQLLFIAFMSFRGFPLEER